MELALFHDLVYLNGNLPGGILGGEGFGLFGGGLCPMLPAPNVKQDNDFVSQSPHCLLITSPSPSTWVAHHSAPLPL